MRYLLCALAALTAGAAFAAPSPAPKARAANLYVANNGSDSWSGALPAPNKQKTDGPFATLERARDEVRKWKAAGTLPRGGVVIEVQGGIYELTRPLALDAQDSGTAEAPIEYRASKGTEVRLVGGKVVTGWQPVRDAQVLARLDESARGKVLQADLRTQGITDFGTLTQRGMGQPMHPAGLELFFNDRPMQLSRWPNEGFIKVADVVGGEPMTVHGRKGDKVGKILYDGDHPRRWVGEPDIWLHGYWFWDWADQYQKVESLDPEARLITLTPPHHGFGYAKGQRFYAINVLAELDTPGEWYLDREKGILYFWPPTPAKPVTAGGSAVMAGKPMVSVLPSMVTLNRASHVTLRGFIVEAVRGTGITISGGEGNTVAGCTLRNLGNQAVSISGGKAHRVLGCDIYDTGDGGISLSGGDRMKLIPAGHAAENNHIHHYSRWCWTYRPGVSVNGVGNRVRHNLIHDAQHNAIQLSGNDHLIEFNDIHNVCEDTGDVGAFYMGRDWTARGTVIRHNYFHNIKGPGLHGAMAVYLDDSASGIAITGNVFFRASRAAFIGGGRDNLVENNIFVECQPAVHVDARAVGWMKAAVDGVLKQRLLAMPYKQAPWSERYPSLVGIWDDEPGLPKGNVIARNICVGRWDEIEAKARPHVTLTDNLLDQDPLFVDAARQNFQLRDNSPAYKLGFQRIPTEKIGPYQDENRASWPVRRTVRLVPAPTTGSAGTPARVGAAPVLSVPHLTGVKLSAEVAPGDWAAGNTGMAAQGAVMLLAQGVGGEKVGPPSHAWLAWDGQSLHIAVRNEVDAKKPVRLGGVWGQDDAVEIALRNPAAGKDAPILVLRGYPNGRFESSTEAGASDAAAKKAAQGVKYTARVVRPGLWTAEWSLPLASLGVDPAKHSRLEFNLTARKSANDVWLMWTGTRGCSWEVGNAGVLTLAR